LLCVLLPAASFRRALLGCALTRRIGLHRLASYAPPYALCHRCYLGLFELEFRRKPQFDMPEFPPPEWQSLVPSGATYPPVPAEQGASLPPWLGLRCSGS
jgi:hypothetical protein